MSTVTIEEAQAKLTELIHELDPGQEMVITENDQPVAKLVRGQLPSGNRPQPGLAKGMITVIADDDEHLKDFFEH